MGRACGTYRGEEKCIEGFGGEAWRDHLQNLGVDNIKTALKETGQEGVDWIHLAHDRKKWHNIVNTVTNLCILQNIRNFLPS